MNSPPQESRVARKLAPKRELLAWMLFDFANSSYTTLIVTIAFSAYFVKTVVGVDAGDEQGKFLWGVANFVSQLIVVLSAPVVGALADSAGVKKRLLLLTYVGCVAGTASLGLVGPGDIALGMALFVASNVLYSSGENLIAAFLPEIAPPAHMGRVSGFGWALGYAGALISILICMPFLANGFGPDNAGPVRLSFVLVAAFFFVGGLPTFLFLRERAPRRAVEQPFRSGFRRVVRTLEEVRRHRQLFRFLPVFFVYNCGIMSVISFASIYADEAIGMTGDQILTFFLVVQISAALGAFLFGFLQDRTSARTAIVLSLVLWLAVCVAAFFTRSVPVFYAIGNVAGIAMGASQSGARALVGTFSPTARTGEFFGFWGLFWKLSSGVGPLVFGAVSDQAGLRPAIAVTGMFFVLGIVGMAFIDEAAGRREAELDAPIPNT